MIELSGVSKTFGTGADAVKAVQPLDLTVGDGEIAGIVGFSGAGKSTLLRLINRLEEPTSGSVIVDGTDITQLSGRRLREERRRIGVIFQGFNLLSSRTALDNVGLALELDGCTRVERRRRSMVALERVGMAERAKAYPAQLSGGQKQRVAIARALVTEPKVLLSDEATSALDPHTTLSILHFLRDLNADLGLTLVIVTHEINVVSYLCDTVSVMEQGAILEGIDLRKGPPEPSTPLGRFLFESASGWDEDTVLLAQQVAGATT